MEEKRQPADAAENLQNRTVSEIAEEYGGQRDERVALQPRPPLPVVAALIERPGADGTGEYLLCRRPAHKARGLLWEFPGGKVEPGETGAQALARECCEELAVALEVGQPVAAVQHEYPDVTVQLVLYRCRIAQGQPQPLEHVALEWVAPAQVAQYDLAPADVRLWQQAKDRL